MDSRNGGGPVTTIGKRQSDLKKSFKLIVRSLLTTCPTQEFNKAFPKFSSVEQEHLHQLFIQVITSLHGNIEDEFESLCNETQVGDALDTVEQLVEEQSLDPLSSNRTNVMDAVHNFSAAKKAEIHYLRGLLERIESRRRFRILRSWDQDGYRMAEVEWVQDIPPRDATDREDLLIRRSSLCRCLYLK